jgi:hypothetical protein
MRSTSSRRRARRLALLATTLAVSAAAAMTAESSLASPVRGCPVDRPCIESTYYTAARNVYVTWTATEHYDHYNVLWWRPGRNRTQVEVRGGRSGWFRVRNARSWTTYEFAVQGCKTRFLAPSRCSPWEPAAVKVRSFRR